MVHRDGDLSTISKAVMDYNAAIKAGPGKITVSLGGKTWVLGDA